MADLEIIIKGKDASEAAALIANALWPHAGKVDNRDANLCLQGQATAKLEASKPNVTIVTDDAVPDYMGWTDPAAGSCG